MLQSKDTAQLNGYKNKTHIYWLQETLFRPKDTHRLKAKGPYTFFSYFLNIFLTSLLECNCFTVVCQFLLYNEVNQLQIYIYPHIFSLLHLPPILPISPLQVVTNHRADLPVLCGCFPLAIYFTFGSVYISMPVSHFVPADPSPSPCPQVHSLHLRLYSCPAPRFFRTIIYLFIYFRFRIYVLACGISFPLSELLHFV